MQAWYKFKAFPAKLLRDDFALASEHLYDLKRVTVDDFSAELLTFFNSLNITIDR